MTEQNFGDKMGQLITLYYDFGLMTRPKNRINPVLFSRIMK